MRSKTPKPQNPKTPKPQNPLKLNYQKDLIAIFQVTFTGFATWSALSVLWGFTLNFGQFWMNEEACFVFDFKSDSYFGQTALKISAFMLIFFECWLFFQTFYGDGLAFGQDSMHNLVEQDFDQGIQCFDSFFYS